jgi:outer membrane lipoprotein-sorting protein
MMPLKNLSFAALLLCFSAPLFALDGTALLAEVDRTLQPESYEMYRKLFNVEPDGSTREYVLYTVKQGQDKMAALFLDPPSEKGRSTLRLGDNMWLYIPNVGKPLRITSLQSVVGGVFNNSDILRVDYSSEYQVESAEENSDHFLLTLRAKEGNVAYDKLIMQVDRQHKVPTTIEAYAASGMLIKTLHYSDLKDFGGGLIRPARLETDSPLYKGYKSVMLFARIQARKLDEEVFTLNYLPKLDDLR